MSDFFLNISYKIGYNFCKQGKYNSALEELIKATGNKLSANYDVEFLLGYLYFRKEMYEEAKQHFEHCIEINAEDLRAYCKLIEISINLKHFQEGEQYLSHIPQGRIEFARYKAALLYSSKNFNDCIPYYDQILQYPEISQDESITVQINKAQCLLKQNQYLPVKDLFDSLKNKAITNNLTKKKLFYLELALSKYEWDLMNAKKVVNEFKIMFKDDIEEGRYLSAQVDYLMENYDEVIQFENALKTHIRNVDVPQRQKDFDFLSLFYVACSYRDRKDTEHFDNIMQLIQMHKKIQFDNEEYYLEFAKTEFVKKNFEECEKFIDKALEKNKIYIPALRFAVFFYNHKKKIDKLSNTLHEHKKLLNNHEYLIRDQQFSTDIVKKDFSFLTEHEILEEGEELIGKKKNFRFKGNKNFIEYIGEGGFGSVTKERGVKGQNLACKRLFFGTNLDEQEKESIIQEFKEEIKQMLNLEHKNVVKLEGFIGDKIMMEFLPGGDLDGLIRKKIVPIKMKIYFCIGIAEGLAYIHEHEIVHGDLKPKNILLDKKFDPQKKYDYNNPDELPIPKICDFGLSSSTLGSNVGKAKGATICYTAPEVFSENNISFMSDMFSYGLTLYELFGGKPPYASATSTETIKENLIAGNLPDFDADLPEESCPFDIKEIITESCQTNPDDRLTAADAVEKLRSIFESYEE